jgi:serine/threonine-protein kinase RsbT
LTGRRALPVKRPSPVAGERDSRNSNSHAPQSPASKHRGTDSAGVRVPIKSDLDIIVARQRGRELAKELGFSGTDLTLIATAISELARNIVLYAKAGEIVIGSVRRNSRNGITVEARDQGPGIPDLRRALNDGFSTSRSLGLGLPGVRRLMDEFEISSETNRGTTVRVKKWIL